MNELASMENERIDSESEYSLLLECLRPQGRERVPGAWEHLLLADWVRLFQQASERGVAPLAYRRLKELGSEIRVPAAVMVRFRQAFLESTARNLRLYNRLDRVLSTLASDGIPVIVLKGAYLAQFVYGRIGLRPMVDVDLLVKPRDLARVEEHLLRIGYIPDEKNKTAHAEACSHYGYLPANPSMYIEVHWNIVGSPTPFRVDLEGLWRRAEPISIGENPALALSPEDLLMHIFVHISFNHLYSCSALRSLCDIAEVIRHYGPRLNWDALWQRSRQWGADNCAYLTLCLVKAMLGADMPGNFSKDLKPIDFDPGYIGWAQAQVFAKQTNSLGPESDDWGRLAASKRIMDKISVLASTCFPSPRLLREMYSLPPGSNRLFLYYPAHLGSILRRHARIALRLLLHDEPTAAWLRREAARVELITIKNQVLRPNKGAQAWINQDPGRVERLAVVRWLACTREG